jgi:UDP-GlcNAc3NAcA epimerase
MKVLSVLGARPQFIKASVVSAAMAQYNNLEEIVVHTGQHFDSNMSDVFFSELGMSKPAYQLDIHGGGHGDMTGRMLIEIEKVLLKERPNCVLVYGDTNSTLAGALAASKMHIPTAHVEAGLRSFNMAMPEEINRILTDRISSLLFCPTETAVRNLKDEGFVSAVDGLGPRSQVFNVGDVMYDAALYFGARSSEEGGLLHQLNLKPKEYILATIHRAENTDHPDRLMEIFKALAEISSDIPVVLPLHPRTKKILGTFGNFDLQHSNIKFIDPVGYLDMVQLEKYAALIATDSGGVQKEAFFFKVPCVTLRDETEWVELVAGGWNVLAPPTDAADILAKIKQRLGSTGADIAPYGNGDAATRIVEEILNFSGHLKTV